MNIYAQLLDQQQAEDDQDLASTQTRPNGSGTTPLYNDGLAQQRSETNQPLATNLAPTNPVNTKQPNIYGQILDQQQAENDQRLHTTLDLASQIDPEQAAQAAALAKRLSLPVEAIANNLPEAQRRTQMADVVSLANSNPALKRQLSNPEFAKIAHDDTENLSQIEGGLSYLKGSAQAGGNELLAAGAQLADALNPFGLSDEDAAILYQHEPEKLQKLRDNSGTMALSRFARERTDAATQNMADISPLAKQRYEGLQYDTTDTDKAAWASPVRILGDVVRSLPTTAALAVTTYLTQEHQKTFQSIQRNRSLS